jgi:hypothetical protein
MESACLDPRLLDGTVRSRAEAPSLASANSLSNACPGHSPEQARHYLKPKCCLGNASVSRYFTVDAAASAPAPACQGVGWAPLGGRRQASSCRAEFGCSSYSYFEPILVGRGRRWRAWQAGAASLVVAWPAMLPSRALPALTSHRLRARRHRPPPFYENRLLRRAWLSSAIRCALQYRHVNTIKFDMRLLPVSLPITSADDGVSKHLFKPSSGNLITTGFFGDLIRIRLAIASVSSCIFI